VCDIVWGVEVYEGRMTDVLVVMVCWSYICEGTTVDVIAVRLAAVTLVRAGRWI